MLSWCCSCCPTVDVTTTVKTATPIAGSGNIHEDTDSSFCHSSLSAFSCPNLHRSYLLWLRCNFVPRWRSYRQRPHLAQGPTFGQLRWSHSRLRQNYADTWPQARFELASRSVLLRISRKRARTCKRLDTKQRARGTGHRRILDRSKCYRSTA